ncbi:hypothetical protein OKW21_002675 [Catalinimonas alkaloidigena]|uniref:hypothetical protein n=1 Tax=Catalinimonas alkaloidigena TaxID=1075417 RepID=UPI0024067393|nr:hypothetical protein [Catalinimonas alkaloidigena]MDF9797412.1 hypothetical protein [Catalinimonas alkaloidigena]
MKISTVQKKQPDKSMLPVRFLKSISIVHIIMILLIGGAAVGTSGCKAKKEARAAAAAKAERIAEARATLLAIINDNGSMTLEEKESELNRIKDMNIDDAEIQDLIARAEAIITRERNAADRVREATGGRKEAIAEDANTQLTNIFNELSSSRSTSDANYRIREALSMFSSPDTPVLIIISQSGGTTDYDEPTTIKKYLEYLKDTKSQPAAIHNLEVDANGKIKEVELIKNYR